MNNENLYLTIDTKLLKSKMPEDTTLYLKKEIEECYNKVCLKISPYVLLLNGF